jgi:UDPglucose--hexose-1-phosphate uridylyltransferase
VTAERWDPVDGEWRLDPHGGHDATAACVFCDDSPPGDGSIVVVAERSESEVVLYGPHETALPQAGPHVLETLVQVWAERYADLGARKNVQYVFVHDGDTGEAHTHGRIDAYDRFPPRVQRQLERAARHLAEDGACLACTQVAREEEDGVRVVDQNDSFVAFVPFAARVTPEVHVVARRHAPSLLDLSDPERSALARILGSVLEAGDAVAGANAAYSLAVLQAPTDDGRWQSVSHFRVELTWAAQSPGALELGAGIFAPPSAAEDAAARLRAAVAGRR